MITLVSAPDGLTFCRIYLLLSQKAVCYTVGQADVRASMVNGNRGRKRSQLGYVPYQHTVLLASTVRSAMITLVCHLGSVTYTHDFPSARDNFQEGRVCMHAPE